MAWEYEDIGSIWKVTSNLHLFYRLDLAGGPLGAYIYQQWYVTPFDQLSARDRDSLNSWGPEKETLHERDAAFFDNLLQPAVNYKFKLTPVGRKRITRFIDKHYNNWETPARSEMFKDIRKLAIARRTESCTRRKPPTSVTVGYLGRVITFKRDCFALFLN